MLVIKDKIKAWYNMDKNGICPKCGDQAIDLDEEGGSHEGYKCLNCNLYISVEMERVPSSVTIYEEETDTEIVLFDHNNDT